MVETNPGTSSRPLRVAVVGSGPSGFYAAEALFKTEGLSVCVDMFDRLPTPYGLVRGGVAPDHQKIKGVTRVYEKIAAHEGFRFFGNVELGRDLQVEDLTACYDQIVYAVGNESDRSMGIPGEELGGVYSATEFVGWYNGHPAFCDRQFDLSEATRVAVIGNGNVAMDVTRVLLQNPETLAETDISDHALTQLRSSSVKEVVLLGRRGPAQAAFSPKEIKEIAELEGCDLVVEPSDAKLDELSVRWLAEKGSRAAQRNADFLTEQSTKGEGESDRKVRCRFLVSPVELQGEGGGVCRVRIERSELYEDDRGTPRPRGLDQFDEEEVQLVFRAVGYRGVPIAGVPFNEDWGTIPHAEGRVLTCEGGEPCPGHYVVGWAKRGPTGLIGTNSADSKATVESMVADASSLPSAEKGDINTLLADRSVDFVSWTDWQNLDRHETEMGESKGKVRDKLISIEAMMDVIGSMRDG